MFTKLNEFLNNVNLRKLVFTMLIVIIILGVWNCYLSNKLMVVEGMSATNPVSQKNLAAIKNLGNLVKQIQSGDTVTIPGNLVVKEKITTNQLDIGPNSHDEKVTHFNLDNTGVNYIRGDYLYNDVKNVFSKENLMEAPLLLNSWTGYDTVNKLENNAFGRNTENNNNHNLVVIGGKNENGNVYWYTNKNEFNFGSNLTVENLTVNPLVKAYLINENVNVGLDKILAKWKSELKYREYPITISDGQTSLPIKNTQDAYIVAPGYTLTTYWHDAPNTSGERTYRNDTNDWKIFETIGDKHPKNADDSYKLFKH